MGVEIGIRYEGDLHCEAVHGPSGNRLMTDAPVDNGGRGEAFSPTDLVATALGTCLLTIIGLAAKRQGLRVDGVRAHVVKEMVSDPVRRIGALRADIRFPEGVVLTESERAMLETAARACPVKQSLSPDVHIAMEFYYPD
ncbi:MAG TPA: OsmC family protein [bacterium]|nr:OsmC family protein [bacterium]